MDGWVTIGTQLDTKQLEQDLKNAKKELTAFQKEEEKLLKEKSKVELDLTDYDEEKAKIQANTDLLLEKAKTEEQVTYLLDKENLELEQLESKHSKQLTSLEEINQKLKENQVNQGLINDKIDEANAKLSQAKGYSKVKEEIGNINDKMSSIIKKVGKWALAVFSVRSAYSLIRQASSTLSQYNEQYATDLEYIKYVLSQALAPVLEYLVKLAYQLLTYINYISSAWFGLNLFSKASAKNFQSMKNSAKEIQKSLAGFDEMNVLGGNTTTSSSLPSFDLSQYDFDIPNWIKWIANNKDIVLNFFKSLAVVIATVKIGEFIINIAKLTGAFTSLTGLQLVGFFGGIAIAIVGVIATIMSLIDFIKNPSWENFNSILGDLIVTLGGVSLAMLAFNATNPVGWVILAVDAVLALVLALSSLIKSLVSDKAQILSTKEAQEQLTDAIKETEEATNDYVNAVDNAEEAQKKLEEAEKENKISGEELYNSVENGILDYKDMTDAQKEVYKAYLNNKTAQEKLQTATENLTEAKENEKKASWENQLAIAKESKNYDDFKKSIVDAYEKGELSAEEARDYIERAMAGMSDSSKQTFTKDLPNDIQQGLDPNKYESIWTKFKNKWNSFWSGLKTKLNMNVSADYSSSGSSSGFAKGGIVYHNLPHLATGGIINQPGRGVPITSAVGGEAGREGVIPLTDSQQMAMLGENIGKYITINANIVNSMNGRVISRQLQKIQGNQDFAYNT